MRDLSVYANPAQSLTDAAAHNQDRDDHAAQRVSRSSSKHQPFPCVQDMPANETAT